MLLTIEVFKEESEYIAKCKELNVFSYGKSSEKAVKRLHKVINFYLQSATEYLDPISNEIKELSNKITVN